MPLFPFQFCIRLIEHYLDLSPSFLVKLLNIGGPAPLINSDLGIIGEVSLPRAEPQTGGRSQLGGKHSTNPKCEPITIPLCTNIEYNMTIMPNLLG